MLDEPTTRGDAARRPLAQAGYTFAPSPARLRTAFSRGATMARVEVRSEITGTVWQIKASVGDRVEAGDTLMVIESMKMEIPVITEDPGVVQEILVKEKDAVAEGRVVAVLDG
jgi:acetyl-CoA carboxylase biotin carboxyl carrier protein